MPVGARPRAFVLTVRGRRVPLHGPHGVAVVGRDVVALGVDVKEYIHIVGQRVLVHVGVAQARVVRGGVLLVQHGRVRVAHPAGLLGAYFHGASALLSSRPVPFLLGPFASVRSFVRPPPLKCSRVWGQGAQILLSLACVRLNPPRSHLRTYTEAVNARPGPRDAHGRRRNVRHGEGALHEEISSTRPEIRQALAAFLCFCS